MITRQTMLSVLLLVTRTVVIVTPVLLFQKGWWGWPVFFLAAAPVFVSAASLNLAYCFMCSKRLTTSWRCRTCQYRAWAIERTFKWPCTCGHTNGQHDVEEECSQTGCPCKVFISKDGAVIPALAKEYFDDQEAAFKREAEAML